MLTTLKCAIAGLVVFGFCVGQASVAEVPANVQAKAKTLAWIGSDPVVVEAVKEHNAHLSPEATSMANETWKGLTILDKFVRSFSKNAVVEHLKEKQDPAVSELFISGADGTKVAFFAKTSSWSHKGKDKHELPMKGEVWFGDVEVDDSTGVEQIQVGFPVLDGETPIGSVVVGLALDKLGS